VAAADDIAGCSGEIDLVFVLDSAGTVHAERWKYVMDFVEKIVNQLDVASDRTRVAVIYYSDSAYVGFTFDRYFARQVRSVTCNTAAMGQILNCTIDIFMSSILSHYWLGDRYVDRDNLTGALHVLGSSYHRRCYLLVDIPVLAYPSHPGN